LSLNVDVRGKRDGFSLDAAFTTEHGVTALFGRSGAGKTTIVSMVAGLLRPRSGRIFLNGRTLFDSAAKIDLSSRQRKVGFVFQEARLFPHLSVRSNLLYARWAGRRQASTTFDAIVALLGLEEFLDRKPGSLSGGEAQRVAIGRALLSSPDILLMDEPLSQLDGARRAEILPFLERLAHQGGVPILYVSHVVEEVARLADSIVVLSEGRVVTAGPIEEVFGRIDLGVATGRYEASTILTAMVSGHDQAFALTELALGHARLSVPRLPHPVGVSVRLRVRARDVALSLARPETLSIRNIIPATVDFVAIEEGAYAEVLLSVSGQHLRARITRKSALELKLRPGSPVFALIKSIAIDADRHESRRTASRQPAVTPGAA
jgi:molybdate transport system ATP-binding protein